MEFKALKNEKQLMEYLSHFKCETQAWLKTDKRVRKPNWFPAFLASMEQLNLLIQTCRKLKFRHVMKTPKGTIMKNRISNLYGSYDVDVVRTKKGGIKGAILTIVIGRKIWVFKHGALKASQNSNMTGVRAYKMFLGICKEEGIDVEEYALSEEEAIKEKEKIESPLIFNTRKATTFYGVNHLDFNSAWPSSVIAKYPELEPVYAKLSKDAKNSLNGYLQSEFINYKYVMLAKAGINGCNAIIRDYIYHKLPEAGFEVLGVNTDGIWYRDKTGQGRLYTDENEGVGFGKWKHDYVNCEFYASSDGQYYFITPDGKFHAKARGDYNYAIAKPREEWTKEDYFKAILTNCTIHCDEKNEYFYSIM